MLLTGAVLNFPCSNVESNVIKQCIIDSITQAIAQQGKSDNPSSNIGLGGSVSSGVNNQYNAQFNKGNQDQFVIGKKSKLKSNQAATKQRSGQPLAEDMQPEILEDY